MNDDTSYEAPKLATPVSGETEGRQYVPLEAASAIISLSAEEATLGGGSKKTDSQRMSYMDWE